MSSSPDIFQLKKSDEAYPQSLLSSLGTKAPELLYCQGNAELLLKEAVGFCGSRKASSKGLETTEDCADQAAKEHVVVVSGNAAGVDLHAHRQALSSGGETILVLPEGINNFSIRMPFREFWDWDKVLVISQFDPTAPWRSYHAMARNRVILGLSSAMIVIEAGEKGGTLDAGKATLKANLPLFVANYENVLTESAGNKILIEMGGIPLNRSKATNRANMLKVWRAFSDANMLKKQPNLL